jgi:ribosome maturation factor RimP
MAADASHQPDDRRLTSTGKAAEIEDLIAPTLDDLGYRIVRVLLTGNARQQRLQIMAERADGSGMDVDGCAEVSRAVEAILDVEDPVAGAYELEVSSPGMDRPLTRLEDFQSFAGYQAKVELREPFEGRRRLKGELLGLVDGEISMAVDGMEWRIGFDEVDKAKLVLTDEMVRQVQKAAKQADKADTADPQADAGSAPGTNGAG